MPKIITANGNWRIRNSTCIEVVEGSTERKVRLLGSIKYVPPSYEHESKQDTDPVTVEYEILSTVGGDTRRARVITKKTSA